MTRLKPAGSRLESRRRWNRCLISVSWLVSAVTFLSLGVLIMWRVLWLLTCAVTVSVPSLAGAQSADRKGGPEKGTWGAEASVGGNVAQGVGEGGSLLLFVSPRTAIVGGVGFSRISSEARTTQGPGGSMSVLFTSASTFVAANVGLRRYTRTGLGLRPVFGGGLLLASRSGNFGPTSTNVGGYAEAGAAWFFNPHVSLGVLGGLNVVDQDRGGWSTSGSLARLTGAVYF